ncbi:hypothetical protein D3C81_1237190 [compost metagenome]
MHYSPIGIFYIDEGEREDERGYQYFSELLSLESIDTENSQHRFQQRLREIIRLLSDPQEHDTDSDPEVSQEQIDSYEIFYNYIVAASTFEDIPRFLDSPFGLREAPPSYWHAFDENAGSPGIPSASPPAYAIATANLPAYSAIAPLAATDTAADDRDVDENAIIRSVFANAYIPIPTYQQATASAATEPSDGHASRTRRRERRSTV